jgi:hypothetical protein
MKTIYLNIKTSQGVETVDQFTSTEFKPCEKYKSFRQYVNAMVYEYHIAGMNVYKSLRPTNEWKLNSSNH